MFAGVVWGSDQRAQFDRLKAEARSAAQAWTGRKPKRGIRTFCNLPGAPRLELRRFMRTLCRRWPRSTSNPICDKLEALYQQRVDRSLEGLDRGLLKPISGSSIREATSLQPTDSLASSSSKRR